MVGVRKQRLLIYACAHTREVQHAAISSPGREQPGGYGDRGHFLSMWGLVPHAEAFILDSDLTVVLMGLTCLRVLLV